MNIKIIYQSIHILNYKVLNNAGLPASSGHGPRQTNSTLDISRLFAKKTYIKQYIYIIKLAPFSTSSECDKQKFEDVMDLFVNIIHQRVIIISSILELMLSTFCMFTKFVGMSSGIWRLAEK